jgi:hypothetical protein
MSTPAQRAINATQPLYGHTSEATAYFVDDYPYGFRERTQIRYWLEAKPKRGWRFISQTMNPKTGRWNKPKASTYAEWGAAMCLDGDGHVQWTGVGPYSDEQAVRALVTMFPEADMRELRKVVPVKLRYLRGRLSGEIVMLINKVPQPMSETAIERTRDEMAIWEEIGTLLDLT